jgi:glyceraldehyde-3-phosphate dehydrogenase/erythrose-4-phosphate dehydrogenase
VVIAGFGRVGQIVARTLAAKRILEKLQARARAQSQELEDLLTQDAAEQAKSAGERAPS